MASLLAQIRKLNGFGGRSFAEPFAGGAGASLTLLYNEEAHEIYINDADPAIHSFWWSLLNRSKQFMDLLSSVDISIEEWYRQRGVYREGGRVSRVRKGFSAFYLNRCNRSGIIMNGGPIGGIQQNGRWKIDARFNKSDLKNRCERIVEYRDRIRVSCLDGIEFINGLNLDNTFLFIDPPYFVKGGSLYLNALNDNYHESLAEQLKEKSEAAWILTYDDCPQIRKMYSKWASIRPFGLRYAAAERRCGKEILITPKWMRLPSSQNSAAITW